MWLFLKQCQFDVENICWFLVYKDLFEFQIIMSLTELMLKSLSISKYKHKIPWLWHHISYIEYPIKISQCFLGFCTEKFRESVSNFSLWNKVSRPINKHWIFKSNVCFSLPVSQSSYLVSSSKHLDSYKKCFISHFSLISYISLL